ncbi:hypothetical protein FZC35_02870 [Candidatus Cytomitobacter indipagum]|uniref:Uncharacterized protein n=1 Tax=Candidatus Cytomitobacter indipagum TaxID=2601575 RepID=A0A5C0UF34_9PROT|nr:hypothetical protein [Candidatus Cytomitobacter indipagum]QEK38291.1 hypothetical protein FZC35_02870 [Candidatus Cytomitobacter indipagum]
MNFLKDLESDHLKDQVKDFFKSKLFFAASFVFLGWLSYYSYGKRNAFVNAELASESVTSSDYETMKRLVVKDANRYDLLRLIIASNIINNYSKKHESELHNLLTGIKDDVFADLVKIFFLFEKKESLRTFKSINSPWSDTAHELDVMNCFSSPDNHLLLPIFAAQDKEKISK